MRLKWTHAAWSAIGLLDQMLDDDDERSAREQLDAGYAHAGGWLPFEGFVLRPDNSLKYPGDPALYPITSAQLRSELIVIYPHAWVAIIQPDRTFEICRMD